MHYTGLTYRPPYEANSLLLQATSGCSHNRCTFCSMYLDTPFTASLLAEIEEDLIEAARIWPDARRVFLVNGDAFALSSDRLLEISELVHRYLPQVESIGAYARVDNIAHKTDRELAALARGGYAEINIGVESGLDDVLAYMNKGYTAEKARRELARLTAAGLPFNTNIITAAAGPDRIAEHATANAALVNETNPSLVFVSPLHVDPGSRLEREVAAGRFTECTLGQYLEEEILFLEELELDGCLFFGLHVSNPVPVAGWLPRDKTELLERLRAGRDALGPELLASHPSKGAEGSLHGRIPGLER